MGLRARASNGKGAGGEGGSETRKDDGERRVEEEKGTKNDDGRERERERTDWASNRVVSHRRFAFPLMGMYLYKWWKCAL